MHCTHSSATDDWPQMVKPSRYSKLAVKLLNPGKTELLHYPKTVPSLINGMPDVRNLVEGGAAGAAREKMQKTARR
jgi:hypothetical protein